LNSPKECVSGLQNLQRSQLARSCSICSMSAAAGVDVSVESGNRLIQRVSALQSTEQPTYSTRRVHTRSNTLVSFFKLSAHQQQHSSTTICPRQAALQLRAECWGNRDFELLQRTSKRSKPTTKGDTSEEAPERQSLKKGLDFSSPETQEHDAPSTPPPPPFVRVSDLVDMSDDTSYTPAEHKADLETPERVKREPVSLRCCLSSA